MTDGAAACGVHMRGTDRPLYEYGSKCGCGPTYGQHERTRFPKTEAIKAIVTRKTEIHVMFECLNKDNLTVTPSIIHATDRSFTQAGTQHL